MAEPTPAAPEAIPEKEMIAQVKSMVELPETASDIELITVLVNIIANLQEKYEGLLSDAVAMEDKVTNRDLDDYADVITDATRGFWKEQFLANRAAAVAVLDSLREKAKQPEPAPAPAPAAPEAPAVPLRNRLAAIPRTLAALSEPVQAPQAQAEALAVRIRNRAHEISKTEKIPFFPAFARAEKELTTPKE